MIARGAVEGLVGPVNGKPWDHAPGSLLIQEAGGRIANVGTDTYDYRNTDVIASNGVVFDELMQFMADNQ
jgi:myo-inositol-1(or 4)-monophosphatase